MHIIIYAYKIIYRVYIYYYIIRHNIIIQLVTHKYSFIE